jgi:hypothetical protein
MQNQHIMKYYVGPRTLTDFLERPKQCKMDKLFGTANVMGLIGQSG